jgi:hypothetical protein
MYSDARVQQVGIGVHTFVIGVGEEFNNSHYIANGLLRFWFELVKC